MRLVELLVDEVVHDVLDDRRPTRHLIRLSVESLALLDLPDFTAISVDHDVAAQVREVRDHVLVVGRDLGVLDQLCKVLFGDAFGREKKIINTYLREGKEKKVSSYPTS